MSRNIIQRDKKYKEMYGKYTLDPKGRQNFEHEAPEKKRGWKAEIGVRKRGGKLTAA